MKVNDLDGQMDLLGMTKGDKMRSQAEEWVLHNHATWLWMCGKAMEAATNKRHFSIARLVEEARYTKPVQGVDEYKINNTIRRPLADMLVEAVPQCEPYIERRRSACDF